MVKNNIKNKNPKQDHQSKRNYIIITQAPENNINYIIQECFSIIQNYLNNILSINEKTNIEDKDNQVGLLLNDADGEEKDGEDKTIPKPELSNDDEIKKSIIKIFCPKTNKDETEENIGNKNECGGSNSSESDNASNTSNALFNFKKIDNKMNIIDYLNQNIFLMEKYQEKISSQTINGYLDNLNINDISNKIAEIIACLNTLLTTLNDIFKSQGKIANVCAEYFFKNIYKQQNENKRKYNKETEELKQEVINARKIFTPKELSQITFIPKKNVNNWIKNGVKRKVGCGKKKMLLPLRQEVGLYLKKEKENGKKFKRIEIKEIVRKKGIELINKGSIDRNEFNKFTISFSWIKQLLKEYGIR